MLSVANKPIMLSVVALQLSMSTSFNPKRHNYRLNTPEANTVISWNVCHCQTLLPSLEYFWGYARGQPLQGSIGYAVPC
jgi:hypothetical protein